jgi:DNA-binding MarR family transcriptional regulator
MSRDHRPGIIAALHRTARSMVAELVQRLEEVGYPDMQPAYNAVFENIEPDGIRLTELAARAEMTHQSMGELVGLLQRRGFVERRPDPVDRRARLVALTPAGRKLRDAGTAQIAEIEKAWQQRWRRAGIDIDLRAALQEALREADAAARQPARKRPRARGTSGSPR